MNFSYCFLLALAYFDLSYVDSFSAFSISCVQRLEAGAPLICNPHGVTHFTSDVYADVLSHKSHDSKMFEDVRSHLQHMQHMQHIQHVQCTQLYLNCHMSLYFDVSMFRLGIALPQALPYFKCFVSGGTPQKCCGTVAQRFFFPKNTCSAACHLRIDWVIS